MTTAGSIYIRFSKGCAITVTLIGALVLLGWSLNIGALKTVLPHFDAMKANAAFSFVVLGIVLLLLNTHPSKRTLHVFAQLLALGVASIGVLTLAEYLTAVDFGIDQALFLDDAQHTDTSAPGRMSPITAICFTLIGLALPFINISPRLCQRITMLVLLFATLAITGYIFEVKSLYQISTYTSIAPHSTIALILLTLGILSARPLDGDMEIIVSDTLAGLMARRLLILIPPLLLALGWLTLQGKNMLLYDDRFAIAMLVVAGMTITAGIIIGVARMLLASDTKRRQAQRQLAIVNANLEHTIEARTRELADTNEQLKIEMEKHRQTAEEVHRLSLTDELSGLFNRRGFMLLADQGIKLARRNNTPHALIYLDLDGLKTVNDLHGHDAGDSLIRDMAQVLRTIFRDTDILARLGGDEFAVFSASDPQTNNILERIQSVLEQFNSDRASAYPLSFSTGILHCEVSDTRTLLELLAEADVLMYRHKQSRKLKHCDV